MTPEALLQSAASLRRRTDGMAQALTDFRGQAAYQRLTGAPGVSRVALRGVTLESANALADRICLLFDALDGVYKSLDRADAAIAAGQGIFGKADKLREAEALLTPSALDMIATGVEQAREILAEIDDGWRTLTEKFTAAGADLGALREMVPHEDVNTRHQLDRIREKLDALRPAIDNDPLGVRQEFADAVESPLATLQQSLGEASRIRRELTDALAAADHLLMQLTSTVREAQEARAEALAKIDGATVIEPPVDSSVHALGEWLNTLKAKADQGLVKPAIVGVEHWCSKARSLLGEAEAALKANRNPLLARRELRGLMQALKAKAVARGAVEDPALVRLAAEANALLYAKPTPMAQAAALVQEYERLLHGR